MAETWPQYLERLRLHSHEGEVAGLVWAAATAAVPGLPIPRASHAPEESPVVVHIAWDREGHYVDVDVMRGGAIEWFYRNRRTGEYDGSDGPEAAAPLPAKFVERLTQVANHSGSDNTND